ncbi:MAG: prolipoprotein diacylglyceryl transferase, partial [Flammeovirgaceae bacterium]|nr:prolipoprotein diacylglyceryl transferase [Flammeovirgaceae bacterium]MDW8286829.1 prolipoprotein diacylglyceryl transferase [Flammeovirgaceae bacterium]
MEFLINYIQWDVSPEIFRVGSIALRWYGLLFASGFIIGQYIMSYIFKIEGKKAADLDALLITMIVSTVVGARLGHCLFYAPDYYLSQPARILYVWEGGLASHGATIGILIGLWWYTRS